jgi:hypothetical protein
MLQTELELVAPLLGGCADLLETERSVEALSELRAAETIHLAPQRFAALTDCAARSRESPNTPLRAPLLQAGAAVETTNPAVQSRTV